MAGPRFGRIRGRSWEPSTSEWRQQPELQWRHVASVDVIGDATALLPARSWPGFPVDDLRGAPSSQRSPPDEWDFYPPTYIHFPPNEIHTDQALSRFLSRCQLGKLSAPCSSCFVYTEAYMVSFSWTTPLYVLSSQKVLSCSGRATRRWSMYFPIRRSLPARPEPDNTFWDDGTDYSLLFCKYHSKIKTPFSDNAFPVLDVKPKRVWYVLFFQDRPMFSHINRKLSPRPFELSGWT